MDRLLLNSPSVDPDTGVTGNPLNPTLGPLSVVLVGDPQEEEADDDHLLGGTRQPTQEFRAESSEAGRRVA